jgi:hypothetical protein
MFSILASFALVIAVAAQAPPDDSALVAELITANTQVNRINDIENDTAFVFDFLNGARGTAQGGFAVSANSANFPALLTGNGAMTVGVLGPCGANSPHLHPRSTELQIIVQGGPIYTEFIMENGARTVKNTVPLGSATIFPKGSIHFQQNMACEPTIFIASFDQVDPGVSQIAQNFFALDQGVVDATLGEIGVSVLDHLNLPANFILGAQECLDRCNIDRSSFNFSASFKDYAVFSNSTWGSSSVLPASVASKYGAPTNTGADKSALDVLRGGSTQKDNLDISFAQNPLRPAVIGLSTATAVLLLTVISLLVLMARRHLGVKASAHPPGQTEVRRYSYATPYDNSEGLPSRRSMDKV